jgi:hypothetical protein
MEDKNTLTVGELVALLQKEDQNAPIGCSLAYRGGWVNGISSVKHGEDGTVCLFPSRMVFGLGLGCDK